MDLSCSAFHLSCPVEWLCPTDRETKTELAKKEEDGKLWPIMVWQPYFEGNHSRPDQLGAVKDACKKLAIFAPNHIDLLAMCCQTSAFENTISGFSKRNQRIDNGRKIIESCAQQFLEAGIGAYGRGHMVVKAGEFGCLVASLAYGDTFTWLAALPAAGDGPISPREEITAFVGALTFEAFVKRQHNIIRATKSAMVFASFAADSALGDVENVKARERIYKTILRVEAQRLQFPRDLDDPSAYTDDEDRDEENWA